MRLSLRRRLPPALYCFLPIEKEYEKNFAVIAYLVGTRIMQALIDAGADVNTRDNEGRTALLRAAIENDVPVVQFLKNAGARTESPPEAFLFASAVGDDAAVRKLLDDGVAANEASAGGITPLMVAAGNGKHSVVQLLIAAKVQVNAIDNNGETALMYGCKSRSRDTVLMLLKANADATMRTQGGSTALTNAATYFDDADLIRVFLERGAQVNSQTDYYNYTPLMAAVTFGHIKTLKSLIAAGADVNVQHREGTTALMLAAQSNQTEAVLALLNAGAIKSIKDKLGKTALDYAIERGSTDMMNSLKAANASK